VKFTKIKGLIFSVSLILSQSLHSQPGFWLKWTNPVYRIHRNIVDSQWVKVDKDLKNQNKDEKWRDHPVYWHNLTRYYEFQNKFDSAINSAQQTCIKADLYFQDVKRAEQFIDRYYFDAKYLKLYYRKLLYDKLYSNISDTSIDQNKKLTVYYQRQLEELNQTIPSATDININISLPHILFHIKSKNDSIIFNQTLKVNSVSSYKEYLLQYNQKLPLENLNEYPNHLAIFFKTAADTIYSISWSECIELDNENAYLNYAKKYPYSPYAEASIFRADEKCFQKAKEENTTQGYNQYLNKYPNGAFRSVAIKSLEFIKVIPIPYLNKYGYYRFIDSITEKRWIDSLFQFAFPFTLHSNINWSSNGATLVKGSALVVNSDIYGNPEYYYIQKDGSSLSKEKFQSIKQISSALAFAAISGQYGMIDKFGKVILPVKFEKLLYDTELNRGLFYNGSKWGIFVKSGAVVCPPNIESLKFVNDENIPAVDRIELGVFPLLITRDNHDEFVDLSGKKIIDIEFGDAYPFKTNKTVIKQNNRWAVIDNFGNKLFDFEGEIEPLDINIYSVNQNGNYSVLCLSEDTAVLINAQTKKPAQIANYWGNKKIMISDKSNTNIYNSLGILEFQTRTDCQIQYEIIVGENLDRRKRKHSYYWYHPIQKQLVSVPGSYSNSQNPSWLFVGDDIFTFSCADNLILYDLIRDTTIQRSANRSLVSVRKFSGKGYYKGLNDSNYVGLLDKDLQWVIEPIFTDIVNTEIPNLYFVETIKDSISVWEVYDSQNKKMTDYRLDEIFPNEYPNYLLVGKDEQLIWITKDLKRLQQK